MPGERDPVKGPVKEARESGLPSCHRRSKVPCIYLNPGACPVMRFALLIPAIAALGLAACQMPPAVTTGPDVAPVAAPVTTPTPLANIAPDTVVATSTEIEIDADDANTDTGNPDMGNPDTDTADAAETPVAATQPSRPGPASTDAKPEKTSSLTPDDGQPAIETAIETADAPRTITVTPPAAPATTPATTPATANDEAAVPPDGAAPEPPVRTLAEALDEALADPETEPDTDTVEEAVPATTKLALAAPPPPPPPPELAPEALVGLDAQGLRQRLGDADFKRREGPVETWQYRFRTCVVDYFVYAEDADPAVRKWVWRSPVIGGGLDVVACRRALAERDRANPDRANPDRNS